MKKINKDVIIFILISIITICGFSKNLLYYVALYSFNLVRGDYSVNEYIDDIEKGTTKNLSYYTFLIDMNSKILNLQDVNIVKKETDTVIKLKNDYLTFATQYEDYDTIYKSVNEINKLQDICVENNAGFLYVFAPGKDYYGEYPDSVENFCVENYDRFIDGLANEKINTLNIIDEMKKDNRIWEDSFFVTDHHWTPNTGFWANNKICEKLNFDFEFEFDKQYNDLNNYDIKTYEKHFLGSQGKKSGQYFTTFPPDDIDLITPNFETNLTVTQPLKNDSRSGKFEDTVLYKEYIENKDLYLLNPYATYCGGDFRLQIIKNNLSKNDKKVLLIRDSYACVVAPFLSLQFRETHIIDVRNFDYFYGDKINVEDYIKEQKPDYVILLFNGCPTQNGATDFF